MQKGLPVPCIMQKNTPLSETTPEFVWHKNHSPGMKACFSRNSKITPGGGFHRGDILARYTGVLQTRFKGSGTWGGGEGARETDVKPVSEEEEGRRQTCEGLFLSLLSVSF